MNQITFDVIIPTFNRATLVKRAIESVLEQSYPYFNLYIVDDGSTDDTKEVTSSFLSDKRVHYLFKPNSGVSAARNFGMIHSHSLWITFLDSDDQWLPDKLKIQAQAIVENPTFSFFHSNEIWIKNNVRVNPPLKFDKSNNQIFERSLHTCLISPSTVAIKRDLITQLGMFNESLPSCEDYDLWIKVMLSHSPYFISDYLINKYHGHELQLSVMDPLMEYFRVISLFNILENKKFHLYDLTLLKLVLIKKIPKIKKGLMKYEQLDKLKIIEEKEKAL